jgi:hypothetical protein
VLEELEAAALESLPHLTGSARKAAPPPGAACANCGAILQGPFCHACGQDCDTHKRSILHLGMEMFEGLFDFDGRFWRTLPALFFRPGNLARDYMDHRMARHVPPFRTFLVAVVLYFFAADYAAHEMTTANARQKAARLAALATPQGRAAEAARIRVDAVKDRDDDLKDAANDRREDLKDPDEKPAKVEARFERETAATQRRYAEAMADADHALQGLPPAPRPEKPQTTWWRGGLHKATANPELYLSVLFTWGHRVAILLLPIVGLSLAAVYRRRRNLYLYDHLLVAMNLLSFVFLANAAALMLPMAAMGYGLAAAALWTPVNLFQTLRGGYGSSVLGATLKTIIVWFTTVFAFSLLLLGLLVFSLSQL